MSTRSCSAFLLSLSFSLSIGLVFSRTVTADIEQTRSCASGACKPAVTASMLQVLPAKLAEGHVADVLLEEAGKQDASQDEAVDETMEPCESFCADEISSLKSAGEFKGSSDEICDPREGVCNGCPECNEALEPVDDTTQKEMLEPAPQSETCDGSWTGFWTMGDARGDMQLDLSLGADNTLTGGGLDGVGKFTVEGTADGDQVDFQKAYLGAHTLHYVGTSIDGGQTFKGTWTILNDGTTGGFELKSPAQCADKVSKQMQEHNEAEQEVVMADACSFSVEFETMSGGVKYSGSSTGATMQFLISGEWTPKKWLFHSVGNPGSGATSGEMVKKQFAMDQWPTEMRITAGGNDALGYSRMTFVVGSIRVPVVHAPSNIDLSYPSSASGPSMKYWVDGNEVPPRSNTFNVPELSSGTFAVVFETMSGNVKYSGSSTGATMQLLIGGEWTPKKWLFNSVGNPGSGATSGEKTSTTFNISRWPTEMRIAAGGNDALGYQRIDFVLSTGAEYNIVNAPSNIDLSYPSSGSEPSMKYWVDGNEAPPRSNTFPVPPKPCPGR